MAAGFDGHFCGQLEFLLVVVPDPKPVGELTRARFPSTYGAATAVQPRQWSPWQALVRDVRCNAVRAFGVSC